MDGIHFLNSEVSENKQNIYIRKTKVLMPFIFIFMKIHLQQIFERQLATSDTQWFSMSPYFRGCTLSLPSSSVLYFPVFH